MGDMADDVFDQMMEQELLHNTGQCDDWCPLCQEYDDEAEAELDEFYYDDHEGGW